MSVIEDIVNNPDEFDGITKITPCGKGLDVRDLLEWLDVQIWMSVDSYGY